jgi:ABC-2 type transport system ATP-binding protein
MLSLGRDSMISCESVSKYYGKRAVLNKISFEVKKGEILGLLGPNGAGKSTTMNILTGYTSASEGIVRIDGIDILENPEKAKKKIGYLPEVPPLYVDMTVEEYLKFVFKLKYVSSATIDNSMKEIMNIVKISDIRKRLIRNLSKGYKQRVGLAQALVGDPEILIMDEPTGGLDPKQIIDMREFIKKIGEKRTIILSSHILPEISAVCDRVLIINKGEIVAAGAPSELSNKLSISRRIIIRFKGGSKDEMIKIINRIPEVENAKEMTSFEPGTVDVLVEASKDRDIREQLYLVFKNTNFVILQIKPMDLTLEEIFMKVTS